jgi:hypothetical protein
MLSFNILKGFFKVVLSAELNYRLYEAKAEIFIKNCRYFDRFFWVLKRETN